MANTVRRFIVLGMGVAAVIGGVLVYQFRPTAVTSFGWTAYAPLSNTTYVPFDSNSVLAAVLLILLGIALVAGWIGFALGRRRPWARSTTITAAE